MRTVPKEFGPGLAGWARRTQSGQAMGNMALGLGYMGAEAALKNYADWTDRIAAGELPFAKLVVTDDRGRFLIPDLPKASYSVWVRGYGLVDSPKVSSTPGKTLNLTAVPAPSAAAAAEYYPGMYWYSMINIPAKSETSSRRSSGSTR
ncbi:MAG: carboxypeptidase regulatory-like domain-containing protein [Betaproteobacteria bacterium]|nr:MAG: carboxypeptidase regulatory-like domain-containing protein [Betaproteobacteria bacterium]